MYCIAFNVVCIAFNVVLYICNVVHMLLNPVPIGRSGVAQSFRLTASGCAVL